jgi:hypothetical protein
MGYVKLKGFCPAKEKISRINRMGENLCQLFI